MPSPSQVTGSLWFATLVALLVSLGAQVLIGALVPVTAFDWLYGESRKGPIVLVAGDTSFWREDAIIRAMSFGIGAFIACLLAKSHSWPLFASLIATALLATVFAQFPKPATPWQLAVWACAAPTGALLVIVLYRAFNGDA